MYTTLKSTQSWGTGEVQIRDMLPPIYNPVLTENHQSFASSLRFHQHFSASFNRLSLFKMQIKDLLAALAIPAVVLSAAIPQPQDPEIPNWDEGAPENDIVGGVAAAQGDFPFIVSIQRSGSHFCGGTLLNANTVLTAAHCAVGQTAANIKIRAGSLVSAQHHFYTE